MSSHYFYSSQVLSFINPGSLYKLSGYFYPVSGDSLFKAEVVNALGSYQHQHSFYGVPNAWNYFESIFTGTAAMSAALLKISWVGSVSPVLSYFDQIEVVDYKDMISLGVVQIYPEWDIKRETIQNRADHRTKGGKLYSYKWGSFERHTIPIDFIQNSKAATVNSWWATDALIHLKIYSGGVWETNCYHIMNGSAPFPDRVKPYYQYKKGTLVLETF